MEETFTYPEHVTDWKLDLPGELDVRGDVVAYDWRAGTAELVSGTIDLPEKTDLNDFDYLVLAPVLDNGMALIGETDKFVTTADRRITEITTEENKIRVKLAGVPGEEVTLQAFDATMGVLLKPVTATIGADGTGSVTLVR